MILSSLLLSIAANFDKVAILCHKEGCDGMLDRWPLDFQSRVHVFDGAQIDPMFTKHIGKLRRNEKPHVFLVTMSHVYIANTLFNNGTGSYLFLEEDFEVVQPGEHSEISLSASASNIARFVDKDEPWHFLRLGYNPTWRAQKGFRCKAACLCQTVCDGICSISPGNVGKKSSCWIRSTVGYAMHRRAWPALQKLGNCTMDADADKINLSIDNWMPGFSKNCAHGSPVHYLIPGVLSQRISSDGSNKRHTRAMEGFASNCVTPFDHTIQTDSSTE